MSCSDCALGALCVIGCETSARSLQLKTIACSVVAHNHKHRRYKVVLSEGKTGSSYSMEIGGECNKKGVENGACISVDTLTMGLLEADNACKDKCM